MLPLVVSFVFSVLLVNVQCQQMLVRTQPVATANQQQQQAQQPQLLSLQQQQQLLAQLNALKQQQAQQQQQQANGQPLQFIVTPQQQPPQQQFAYLPQQQPPQQFFDPNQQQPPQQFFDPNQQQPPQQFFDPNQQPQPQQFASQPAQLQPQAQPQPPVAQGPQINWGKCPQLEPSDKEKMTKAAVITKCLETTPLPPNITRDTVELHREQIAACALQSEGWFTSSGGYDFAKAETEIRNKKLAKQIEDQVLSYHRQCKTESEEKFPTSKGNVIAQIQLYQACMDYFISDVCGIEVSEPEAPQFTGAQR